MDLPEPVDRGAVTAERLPSSEPALLQRGFRGASFSERVLVVGAIVTGVLIVLAFVDSGRVGLWQNLHWNASALTAFLIVTMSAGGQTGRDRIVRTSAAVGVGMWALANLLWAAQVATNQRVIPSLPDVLAAAVLIPGAVVLVSYVRGRVSRAVELAVYIDAAVVGTTVFAYLLIGLGPAIERLGGIGGVLSVAAPFAYLTMAAAGLVALLATEHPVSIRGGYPIVVGIGVIGLAWIGWAVPMETGLSQPAQFASPLFSIGTLLIALGATRGPDQPASERYRRLAGLSFRVVAPFAASLTVVSILPIVARSADVDLALRVTVILAAALILVRQGLLLRERIRVVGELQVVRGENERLVATLRQELAERARVQDQLLVASRMAAIGELAAGVAHEVNNPLTGVLGYSELLLQEMPEDDPRRPDVQTIWNEAMRARTIVRALRDFARPAAPMMIPADLSDLVTRALDLLRYAAKRANVMIVESHGDLPLIELDSQAIQQVLLNVLTNALQAMPEGGTLTVETFRRDPDVVIKIGDTGEGMDEGVAAQAFVPFFTRRRESGATGLGLSASLGLVEIHGGSIRLDSTVGLGTTVEIRLPISRPAVAAAESAPNRTTRDAAATARDEAGIGAEPSE